jgi:hypothetical protein
VRHIGDCLLKLFSFVLDEVLLPHELKLRERNQTKEQSKEERQSSYSPPNSVS